MKYFWRIFFAIGYAGIFYRMVKGEFSGWECLFFAFLVYWCRQEVCDLCKIKYEVYPLKEPPSHKPAKDDTPTTN